MDTTTTLQPARASMLATLCRALGRWALEGASVGMFFGLILLKDPLQGFMNTNRIEPQWVRTFILACVFGGALAASAAGLVASLFTGGEHGAERLEGWARRLWPLAPVGLLPILFQWKAWRGKDEPFLVLVLVASLGWWAAVSAAGRAPAFGWEARVFGPFGRLASRVNARFPKVRASLPLGFVVAGGVLYTAYFAYVTLCFYWCGRSGYDLGIYDNLFWNLVHGGPFFSATPRFGSAHTSHFGIHAELLAYVLAPFYALAQNAGTLVLLQCVLLGMAVVPLFLLARRYTSPVAACALSVAYLLYPALHGENLFEFHFLPLGPFFFWWAWYLLETRRDVWATVFVLLTLSVREDVAAWVGVLGVYLLVSGRRPRAGICVAAAGAAYFCVMKFVVMPRMSGGEESFADIFQGLIAPGEKGFGSVLRTIILNPGFTASTLVDPGKLVYALQILVPLALLPILGPSWLLLLIPGLLFTLFSTHYGPVISITYQYSANWIAFVFPAAAMALGKWKDAPGGAMPAALVALFAASVPVSYQYGAILQHHTAYGGPIPIVFGIDDVGRKRHRGLAAVESALPPRAKVSGAGFVTPYIAHRPFAYNMTIGLFDADYIVFPTIPGDFIVNERDTVTSLLKSGEFGVTLVAEPFAVAKRGSSRERNAEVLRKINGT